MTKQEFITRFIDPAYEQGSYATHLEVLNALDMMIHRAIAEHEASQWKKYPENQPCDKSLYYVHTVDDREFDALGCQFDKLEVIAFRALPSSYQPTEEGGEG